MEGRDYSPAAPEAYHDTFNCPQPPQIPRKKKNKIQNNRRFSDEQIRLLETIFESETKLESRKKLQLARELGLQPRQVAIWFQNRRARWKSKKMEQDYRTLKASYDSLASQFESLKKEKQSLLIQLQKLSEPLGKHHDGNDGSKYFEGCNTDGNSDNGNTKYEPEAKLSFLREGLHNGGITCSHNDNSRDIGHSGEEGRELLNVSLQIDGSSASSRKWYSVDSGGSFDQSCSSSHWLNFWA